VSSGRLGVLGIGVIGASIALRARSCGMHVTAADVDSAALAFARDHGIIDDVATDVPALAGACDVLVLATPVDAALTALRELPARRDGEPWPRLLMDIASVKVPFAALRIERYVPTHPFAGSEQTGPAAARGDLFEGRAWAYVPTEPQSDSQAAAFIEQMGATPVPIEAEAHDDIAAWASHLPQLVSVALGAVVAERVGNEAFRTLAGPGLRSMVRLAASSESMWAPIVSANAARVGPAVRKVADTLNDMADALDRGDVPSVMAYFAEARPTSQTLL